MRIAFVVAGAAIIGLGAAAVLPSPIAEEEAPAPSFPADWAGTWKGELGIHQAGGGSQMVPMELRIEGTEDPKTWRWGLKYGDQPVRDYRLVVIDASKGSYLIDERNSIELPASYLGGTLASSFAVSRARLTASYRLDGEELEFLIHVTTAEPTTTTGGEDRVPEVKAYGVRSVHRATLRRAK